MAGATMTRQESVNTSARGGSGLDPRPKNNGGHTVKDYVRVKNLCLHGFHGVFPEERKLGQKFYIDIECRLNLATCAAGDDYTKAVCYGELCEIAAEVSQAKPFDLIETLGERIAEAIHDRFAIIDEVKVAVRKPSAPIAASLDYVEIEVRRARKRRIAFSLGSEAGDMQTNLSTALAWMQTIDGVEVESVSRFYKTAPRGGTDQEWSLNACAVGWTTVAPDALLRELKRIELMLGRVPSRHRRPRTVDIDILFVDGIEVDSPFLTLPHKEMFNRAFVLLPLAEIAPEQIEIGRHIIKAATQIAVVPGDVEPVDA